MKKKNKLIIASVLFITILFLCIFLFSNLIDYLSVLEKQEIYAKVEVSDHYGFDINGSALVFGMLIPGTSASKEISIENNHDQIVKIEIYATGEIKDFIRVSENNFVLIPREFKEINFDVYIPKGAEHRIYDGKVVVVTKNSIIK